MARTLKPSIVFRSPDYRNHPDYGAHDYNNQTPRLQVPCFVFGAICQTHTKIKNQANIMAKPCHHHAKIMPISCQHHANIMPTSCQTHYKIVPTSKQTHVTTMPTHFTNMPQPPKRNQNHVTLMPKSVTIMSHSCQSHVTFMPQTWQNHTNIMPTSSENHTKIVSHPVYYKDEKRWFFIGFQRKPKNMF